MTWILKYLLLLWRIFWYYVSFVCIESHLKSQSCLLPQPIGLAVLVIVVEKRQRNFEISPPKPQGEGDMWCLYMLMCLNWLKLKPREIW
jgi:hypothetical protein